MSKPTLVYMMGPTNVGKSTALNAIFEAGKGDVGLVEVGKMLRAKYGEDYFKGQAAPAHTAVEAWNLMLEGVEKHAQDPKVKFVLIDGQPRDFDQCAKSLALNYDRVYVNLYASVEVREARANIRDANNPSKLALSLARMRGDIPMLYEIMSILLYEGQEVMTYRTDVEGYNPLQILSDLFARHARYFYAQGLKNAFAAENE